MFQLDVPLTQLKPGFYTCQVNVIDDAPGQFRTEVGIACEVASTMCTIPLPNNGRGGGPPGVSRDQSQYIVLTRPQIMVFHCLNSQAFLVTEKLTQTRSLPVATYFTKLSGLDRWSRDGNVRAQMMNH